MSNLRWDCYILLIAVWHFEFQDAGCVAVGKDCAFTQVADSSLAFFAEIVSLTSLFVENFPRTSNLESLLGATVCFHFWHSAKKLRLQKLRWTLPPLWNPGIKKGF